MITGRRANRLWPRAVPAAYSLLLATIITGPLLAPGYLLLRDAVSTPRSYLTDSALGLGDAAPRAVPQDGLLAVLSPILDGGLAVKAILLLALWSAGWGAAVLTRRLLSLSLAPQLVATTITLWNPYIAERLLQGHWSLLTGYAALPWTALAAHRIRTRPRHSRSPKPSTTPTGNPHVNGPTTDTHDTEPIADSRGIETTGERCSDGSSTGVHGSESIVGARGGGQAGRSHGDGGSGGPGGGLAAGGSRELVVRKGFGGAGPVGVGGFGGSAHAGGGERDEGGRGAGVGAVREWLVLGGCLAGAGLTPTGSLLAGCVALLVVGRRNLVGAVVLWCFASAPWLVATVVSGAGVEPSDRAGIAAFAARAEPGLGTLGSLAGLGGIWNGDAVPGSRTTVFAAVATGVLLLMVVAGARAVVSGAGSARRTRRVLVGLAGVVIVLPALGATGWGVQVGEFLVARVPGAGLFRDTQKYVALAVPAYALCAAGGCRVLARASRRWVEEPVGIPLIAMLFALLPIVVLPDLTWGVGGALRPVHYPPGWQRVAARIDGPGDIAVLPGGMFRIFPYSGRVPVLDPAPRLLPRDVLQTGELPVRGRTVAGEGGRARAVERLLLRGGPATGLADHGVGWVVVERTTPGPLGRSETTLAQLDPVYSDTDLTLYRVPGGRDLRAADHAARRAITLAAHGIWALLVVAGPLACLVSRATRPRRPSEPRPAPRRTPRAGRPTAPRTPRSPSAPRRIRGRGRGPSPP
ncbi:hypothetical protein [Nocardia terpenica]|uniref:hypothetical protein n=1 Tax=Nocardia terpenica TaxID=455432 RepID=UPI00403998F8